jgi:transmembrane E3 ubiquitin-protein ligase
MPLVTDFVSFGQEIDPLAGSYYSNLTGFWKGDVRFHNLTNTTAGTTPSLSNPFWLKDVDAFVASANLTNVTELADKLGKWRWAGSTKTSVRLVDKKGPPKEIAEKNLPDDIAILYVCNPPSIYLFVCLDKRWTAVYSRSTFSDSCTGKNRSVGSGHG